MKTLTKLFLSSAVVFFLNTGSTHAMPLYAVGEEVASYVTEALQADGTAANVDILARDPSKPYLLVELFFLACGPCRYNFDVVSKFAPSHPNLAVKYLTGHDTIDEVRTYFTANPTFLQGDVLSDLYFKKAGVLRPLGYIPQYAPTSYIIGPDQKVLWVSVGSFDEGDLIEIEAIIGSNR